MNECAAQTHLSDSQPVEMERQTKRKRSGSRGAARRIHKAARERQVAWAEGKRPNETQRLSRELELAFEDLRAATRDPGAPYAGRTTAPFAQPPKPLPAAAGKWPTRRPQLPDLQEDERPAATRAPRTTLTAGAGDGRGSG